ncbi:type II CRISPR RNA-guided endonuclease Cas9 [Terrilactibacillus laevilacticus]|uniref:type II CRISPR RNA-guided endonuclease Cas9 n=1 Tax=Terrilactibacillus laevilacticus TaxID=1380157 RepID=UPI001FE858CD|nr:type II CRISPR RNA-guided endonuclease Cas9 [Terrilactibacillus laevilacticus]
MILLGVKTLKYSIGFDIGISSVGWAVINHDKNRIEDMNVRMFDAAENPKNGSSLAEPRRNARSSRRRLRRRRHRVLRTRQFIINKGLLTNGQMLKLYDWQDEDLDIWLIRVNALERKLTDREFARILIHFAKNRGFKSNRKSEASDKENGVVLAAVKENAQLMEEKGYTTVAQLLTYESEIFKGRKRNRNGEYTHITTRHDLEHEIHIIFAKQREFGHIFANKENEETFVNIWSSQRPFATKDDISKKIGKCTLEPNEKRAPKAAYTFQRFRAIDKLNRLRILSESHPSRKVSEQERELAIQGLFSRKDVKYTDLRKLFNLSNNERFSELFYETDENIHDVEKKVFLSFVEHDKVRKIIIKVLGKEALTTFRPVDFDCIAQALTVFKDDNDIRDYLLNRYVNQNGKKERNLANRAFDKELIEELLTLSFSKFGHLSLRALHRILPHLEKGLSYDKACTEAGYSFNNKLEKEKSRLLPAVNTNEIRNPVVIRSLSQTRKVLNAIIKRYGSPTSVFIELAREMGRPYNERRDLEKLFTKNHATNEKARNAIRELHPEISAPRGHDILKYKLWQEQCCKCAYSFEPISLERLFEPGYVEVDHIIPYSRSFDDSNANKVLVLAKQNQNKRNQTPFEWFGHDEIRWGHFESFVNAMQIPSKKVAQKKRSLLLKKVFDDEQEEAFKSRHLNDTRYITRYFKNFVEENLLFREELGVKQHVFTVNGAYTSLMRKRWGFNKSREENDLHHAVDAVIVAVSGPFRHQISAYFKQREVSATQLMKRKGDYFPQPWPGFGRELRSRTLQDPKLLKMALESLELPSYDEKFISGLKPIFISRMPKRSVKGQIHEETLRRRRGETEKGYVRIITKTKLEDISFNKNGDFNMYGKESDPKTYQAIKQRYLDSGNDKKKAFIKPLYKPSKDMDNAPLIRTIKIEDKKNQIVDLGNGAVAFNGSIVRTEVFRHRESGKFYLAPVYIADVLRKRIPEKFITANKPYDQWKDITTEYEFKFNLYPNDVIKIKMSKMKSIKNNLGEVVSWQEGYVYFKGIDAGTGALKIIDHMNSYKDRIGSQNLSVFEKYQVNPLGFLVKVHGEKRHGI